MEIRKKEFLKLKTLLNNLTIEPGMVLMDQNDPMFGDHTFCPHPKDSRFSEHPGLVLNNGESIHFDPLSKEFLSVRNELNNIPQASDSTNYIKNTIELYTKYESQIIENDDGTLSADFVKFKYCNPVLIDEWHFYKYDTFLEDLKRKLINELQYFQTKQDSINVTIKKNKIPQEAKDEFKSFQYPYEKKSKLTDDELNKLQEFHKLLEEYSLIEQIDFRLFKQIFSNTNFKQPLIWKTKPTELYYVIRCLHDKKIIAPTDNYLQVICKCFLLKNDDGTIKKFTSKYIGHVGIPKNKPHRITVLKSVLEGFI